MTFLRVLAATCLSRAIVGRSALAPLKVFLMVGQSNMEGHGFVDTTDANGSLMNGTLRWLVHDPQTASEFADFLAPGGGWVIRDDIIVATTDQNNRTGNLTVGFGGEESSIGPELSFGMRLADVLGEQVLLLKAVWGGKSLAGDYRPPSAVNKRGNPQNVTLVSLDDGQKAGVYFRLVIETVRDMLGRLSEIVLGYDPTVGYEIFALEWHQGWNDGCDFAHALSDERNAANEYEANLADFVVDMRRALLEFRCGRDMPVIIGASGFAGKPGHEAANCDVDFGAGVCTALRKIWSAQMAVGDSSKHPEVGLTRTVDSVPFLREKRFSPGTQGYHWWNNAETYVLLGRAMADATLAAKGRVLLV